jgi:hypothetical protein
LFRGVSLENTSPPPPGKENQPMPYGGKKYEKGEEKKEENVRKKGNDKRKRENLN